MKLFVGGLENITYHVLTYGIVKCESSIRSRVLLDTGRPRSRIFFLLVDFTDHVCSLIKDMHCHNDWGREQCCQNWASTRESLRREALQRIKEEFYEKSNDAAFYNLEYILERNFESRITRQVFNLFKLPLSTGLQVPRHSCPKMALTRSTIISWVASSLSQKNTFELPTFYSRRRENPKYASYLLLKWRTPSTTCGFFYPGLQPPNFTK